METSPIKKAVCYTYQRLELTGGMLYLPEIRVDWIKLPNLSTIVTALGQGSVLK